MGETYVMKGVIRDENFVALLWQLDTLSGMVSLLSSAEISVIYLF